MLRSSRLLSFMKHYKKLQISVAGFLNKKWNGKYYHGAMLHDTILRNVRGFSLENRENNVIF